MGNSVNNMLARIKQVKGVEKLAEAFEKDYRKDLNANVHILDISYDSLKINVYGRRTPSKVELATYDKVYSTLIQVVSSVCAGRTFNSLQHPEFLPLFNQKKSVGVIFINGGPNNNFLVGKNYSAVQTFFAKYVSKDPRLVATRFGATSSFTQKTDAKGRPLKDEYVRGALTTKVDVGHIATENSDNLNSPLEERIKTVLEYGTANNLSRISEVASAALKRLYDVQADFAYSFKNTAPENIAAARGVLGTSYVVVTLHTRQLNNKFSTEEGDIYRKLLAEVALSLNISTVEGSNSIEQDIVAHVKGVLSGKPTIKQHKEQKGKLTKNLTNKVKTSKGSLTLPVNQYAPIVPMINLQQLIEARLRQEVEDNMGTGDETRILNYRTGRFADSVNLERLSISRNGMISAFYSYMKHPYATFSRGGKQQSPFTRDPKLLISKSLRNIASDLVSNQLRAINV